MLYVLLLSADEQPLAAYGPFTTEEGAQHYRDTLKALVPTLQDEGAYFDILTLMNFDNIAYTTAAQPWVD